MLPPPTTMPIWTPEACTSAISAATSLQRLGLDAEAALLAAERLAAQLERRPAGNGAWSPGGGGGGQRVVVRVVHGYGATSGGVCRNAQVLSESGMAGAGPRGVVWLRRRG